MIFYYVISYHINIEVIKIKRKFPKKRKPLDIPLAVVIIIGVFLIISSYYITINEEIAYISSLTAMPEGLMYEIECIKKNICLFFNSETNKINFEQKSSNCNDSENTDKLSTTPSDILESMNKIEKMFDSGEYIYDGNITEKTYTDYQSTDSFENIFVKNSTETKKIDIKKRLNSDFSLPIPDISKPVVLIYHTHTTETYIMTDNGKFSSAYPERNNDKSVNMIRIGDEITRILESNGIGVIHDKTVYDEVYTGAYAKSRQGIEKILKENPSIIITLDIHRDAIYYDNTTRIKQITQIGNDKAAQLMIITGAQDGKITEFPQWETNLDFALRLQKAANDKYENLMKPIMFCCRKYNMDITPYSLLIEVGTDMNTLQEAAYSGRLLGDVLSNLIKEYAKDV